MLFLVMGIMFAGVFLGFLLLKNQLDLTLIQERLTEVKQNINHIQDLKTGLIEPIPCGMCDWCADNLPLDGVVSSDQLMAEF